MAPRISKKLIWIVASTLIVVATIAILAMLRAPIPLLSSLWLKAHSKPALLVNGETIDTVKFEEAYQDFLSYQRAQLSADERIDFERSLLGTSGAYYQLALRSQLVEDLIRRTLLKQAAKKQRIEVRQEEILQDVRQQLRHFLEQNGLPEDQIQKALEDPKTYRSPFTLTLMEQTRWQLLTEHLQDRIVGTIDPEESDLRSYFQDRKLNYYVPELVHIRHLLIPVSENAKKNAIEAARQKILEIRRQWEQGAIFAQLARQYSEDTATASSGGDYGWIQRGDPAGEAFVDAAFALRSTGDVSAPIQSQQGFHLIQLVERRPPQGESLPDVRDEVRRDYIAEQVKTRFKNWYDDYRAKADVHLEMPLLSAYRLEVQDHEAALRAYEKIQAQGSDSDPYLGYYVAVLYQRELEEAQKKLNQLESTDGHAEEIAQLQTQVHNLSQKIAQNLKDVIAQGHVAEELFQTILKFSPEDASTRFDFALYLISQGRWSEAANHLKMILEAQPKNDQALRTYGELLIRMHNYQEAVEPLELAIAANGKGRSQEHVELELQLAEAYIELGRTEEAHRLLKSILETDPKHIEANRELGLLALRQGEYSQALQYLELALKSAPSDEKAKLQVLMGQAYTSLGDLEKAKRVFQQVLEAPSPPAAAYRSLGELFEKQGNVEQALGYYQEGLTHAVGWDEKEELALLILKLNPNHLESHSTLAELYQQKKRYEEAIQQYEAILGVQPDFLAAWRSLGDIHVVLQQYTDALKAFQRALSVTNDPKEEAGLWARILNVDRAQSKSKLTHTGLEALYQLAQLYLQMGEDQRAATQISQLIAADPSYRAESVARLVNELEQKGVNVDKP